MQGEEGRGTRVWPGSAAKIRELAESDRSGYEKLWQLVQDVPQLELGEAVQLVARCGDIHALLEPHARPQRYTNTGTTPRLCMRFFCSCEACFTRWKKSEEWGHWCPYGKGGAGPFD